MRWRGYTRSTFYVGLPDGAMLESEPFTWRHDAPPPETEAVRSAYERLVERLLAGGWEREGQGTTWYDTHFVRGAPEMAPAPIVHEELSAEPAARARARAGAASSAPSRRVRSSRVAKRELTLAACACVILAAAFVVMGAARTGVKHAAKPLPAAAPKVIHHRAGGPDGARRASAASSTYASRLGRTAPGSRCGAARARERCSTRACSVPGTQLHFKAPRVWARLGAAGNLSIVANGRPVSLRGTYDKVFVPTGS